jgi:hypothetical protein
MECLEPSLALFTSSHCHLNNETYLRLSLLDAYLQKPHALNLGCMTFRSSVMIRGPLASI